MGESECFPSVLSSDAPKMCFNIGFSARTIMNQCKIFGAVDSSFRLLESVISEMKQYIRDFFS